MKEALTSDLIAIVEHQRVKALYSHLPGSIMSMLVGILLIFVFLLPTGHADMLKAWIAYMLTTLALRSWLWHQFRNSIIETRQLKHWEWLYAAGMSLTAVGWMMICGPLYPEQQSLQDFVWVTILFVAFSGMVLAASSPIAFAGFIIPTLLPALYRFIERSGFSSATLIAAAGCLSVIVITHRGLRLSTLQSLQRQTHAEQLLAEQQAIFQGATAGIAVMDSRTRTLIKCNKRFGELFGRGMTSIQSLNALELFVNSDEGERFVTWSNDEFAAGRAVHSMERMRRADGTQFWAELSGRRLEYGNTLNNLWLVTEAAMQQRPSHQ